MRTAILIILTLAVCALFIILQLTISGCMPAHRNTTPTVAPPPAVQMWEAGKKANWLVTLAIPIIALGAVAMFNGAGKLGMSALIFGCVTLFMALATARFALWMAVFGLIGSTTAVVASILARKKALVEIIKGVQKSKTAADIVGVDIHAGTNRVHDKIQSKSTKKIVQDIKGKLKAKGEI